MKHILMNSNMIKNTWIVFGGILLFTMSPFFQSFVYPFWYSIDGKSFSAFTLLTATYLSTPFTFNREILTTVFMFSLVAFNFFPLGLFLQGSLTIKKSFFIEFFYSSYSYSFF